MAKTAKQYVVGREAEVQLLRDVVRHALPYSIVNIYGPGGIGKTVVCQKLETWCAKAKVPYAMVTGINPVASTIDKILYQFRQGLEANVPAAISSQAFEDFDAKFGDYWATKEVIASSGGIPEMFDLAGTPSEQASLKAALDRLAAEREGIRRHFYHRDTLERYIGGVDLWLTSSFVEGVNRLVENAGMRVVLLVDTYEMMVSQDAWMCGTMVKALPPEAKVVILGRDRLNHVNTDWNQYEEADLYYHELQELSPEEAKTYLRHYGLGDERSLERVYSFTGGYPLCLVLVVQLAREMGGWEQVRDLEDLANRDRMASQLLERILRQEKVKEIQEFLEKGVIARWFDPQAVSHILRVSPERGREIYDRIREFSFVSPHPNGLQFHDRVRELLVERLKFMDGGQTYARLAMRWSEHLQERAGIRHSVAQPASEAKTAKQEHLITLRRNLVTCFGEGDLRTLCFDMGIDYDDLPALGKANKARELVIYLERCGRIPELVDTCSTLRPNVPWEEGPWVNISEETADKNR